MRHLVVHHRGYDCPDAGEASRCEPIGASYGTSATAAKREVRIALRSGKHGSVLSADRNEGHSIVDDAQSRIAFEPERLAKRQTASWSGMRVEIARIGRLQPYEYHARPQCHLIAAHDRVVRSAGETRIEGLPPATRRDLSGTMCIVPAGREFSGWDVPRCLPSTTYVFIDPARLPADCEGYTGRIELMPRLFFSDELLWSSVQKLRRLVERPVYGGRLYAESLAAVLGAELAQIQNGAWPAPQLRGGLAGWQLRVVCEQIEGALSEDMSLEQLARSVGLSRWHFCRAFKQSMGVAPHRFQIQRRVERAKAMLADDRRSVTEIALSCGFGCSSNFASTFRKLTGRTPSGYRKSLT